MLDGRFNDSFRAVNLLLDRGVTVRRVDRSMSELVRPGDFIVPAGESVEILLEVATVSGVDFAAFETELSGSSHVLTRSRIGMYQRYFGGNMDEGWTRLLLENFDFQYATLRDAAIQAGNLNDQFDVIILPADGVARMTGEGEDGGRNSAADAYPPEYRSGFGQVGVDALEAFVEAGGTLLTFAEAGNLPIEKFDLPVRNVVAGLSSTEFWSPGSTLRVAVDNTNPIGYGMPEDALATFLGNNQVYQVVATERNERVERVVTFVERDILQSGWLLGENVIAEKAAVVSVKHGEGKVVLIGFRAQHRVQTHGTFKLVFNVLMGGKPDPDEVAAGGSNE